MARKKPRHKEPAEEKTQTTEAPAAPQADKEKSGKMEMHEKYEAVKRGTLHITDLQKMEFSELHQHARDEGIQDYAGMSRKELVFRIIKQRVQRDGLTYGEGVLEILPDGFGFLRSTDYDYLPSQDDIYVSPSQIRRFGLKHGHIVAGQIRPPKDIEKYFALLRVEGCKPRNA